MDEHSPPTTPPAPVPLSPSAFLEAVAAQLDRLHAGTSGVLLRAVPVRGGSAKVYGGFIYATLKDARTGDTIDARVPEGLAAQLEWNREAVFVGLVRYKAGRGGAVRPEFRVDAVHEAGALRLASKDELLQRWAEAAARPKRDLRAALAGARPRLTLITGVGSVAVDDIRAQLRELEDDVDLQVVRVPVTRPGEVAAALRAAVDTQAVVITRGGGEGVQALDDDQLIGAVVGSPVPVAVALGHATDDLVVGRVADACFPTPTGFGAWLRGLLEERRAEARAEAEAEVVTRSQELLGQLGRLQRTQAALAGWRAAALALGGLLVVALLWLLLGR